MSTCLALLLLILRLFLTEEKPPDLSKRVVHAVNCGEFYLPPLTVTDFFPKPQNGRFAGIN